MKNERTIIIKGCDYIEMSVNYVVEHPTIFLAAVLITKLIF